MWRQSGGCKSDGTQREPFNNKSCSTSIPTGYSRFYDCDGDNVMSTSEKGYDCSTTPTTCDAVCQVRNGDIIPAGAATAGDSESNRKRRGGAGEYCKDSGRDSRSGAGYFSSFIVLATLVFWEATLVLQSHGEGTWIHERPCPQATHERVGCPRCFETSPSHPLLP